MRACVRMLKAIHWSVGKKEKLEKCVPENFMQFNKFNCKMLHLYWDSLMYDHRLGDEFIESNSPKKAWRKSENPDMS